MGGQFSGVIVILDLYLLGLAMESTHPKAAPGREQYFGCERAGSVGAVSPGEWCDYVVGGTRGPRLQDQGL